jgi:hypothetical protein
MSTPRHVAHASQWKAPSELKRLASEVEGFNNKVAVIITNILGTMACFWTFCIIALLSLPAVLYAFQPDAFSFLPSWAVKASNIALIAWIAQTFIQLTALSVLQVSNNAQARQTAHETSLLIEDGDTTREHTATILDRLEILDRLDLETQGGLQVIDARLDRLEAALVKPKPPSRRPRT